MQTILVTGAAGFIGSHLCERLLADGRRVVGLDSFDSFYDPKIKRANIAGCLTNSNFRLVEGDIRDAEVVAAALKGCDLVVHLAARAGVRPSIEDPLLYQDVNVRGTNVILETMRKLGMKKLVFASSSSVYGNNKKVPFSETDVVDNPISPYAATKKAGELICHAYHHLFGMDITCLRFFTVYGARQRPDLAIHKFAKLILAGKSIPVFGDGSMMRDHTYIDDIIAGVVAAIDRCGGYKIYNLGESRPVSLSDLIAAIERAVGKKAMIERLPLQPGDVHQTYADVSRAKAELGYEPSTEIEAGLAEFAQWLSKSVAP
ncbi:MAG: epimerase [Planctomycetia bacterium]|jgi:UDP-glucuronate 4-epimerase|nr:GDP-mannose 4,6-dehydratase [Planctomycetota bacterium]OQZ00415.1 MAG: epimerase [Planctomycetes bacterium UTPLA1]